MEMEVVVAVPPPPPLPSMDFNFDSNCSSPYITAPSSPQPFGNLFFSAPTSPTRSFFRHSSVSSFSSVLEPIDSNEENFEFNFSSHLERPSLSAEELFHGGKIRPLKLPSPATANKASSTKREQNRVVQEGVTRKRVEQEEEGAPKQQQNKRGRERTSSFSIPSTTSSCHKGSGRRSLSRVSESQRHSNSNSFCESHVVFTQRGNNDNNNNNKGVSSRSNSETASTFSSFLSSISFSKGYRKWKLKDFLLFRSASEGRATAKDHLRKYAVLSKTTAHEDVVNSSFRSTESSGSVSKRRGPVSAHELHYTLNRAASEELKKKTMLPYKQGLLGCLGFNHGMHQISGRFGSLERS